MKATDLAVYSALLSLGIETKVLPVLDAEADSSHMAHNCEQYLEDGKTFAPEYEQYPAKIPIDTDVDQYWKTLFFSRCYAGMKRVVKFAHRNNLEINPSGIWKQRGVFVGDHLIPYTSSSSGQHASLIDVSK